MYDPLEAFAPLTLPDPVNSYRSGNGAPGPDYWQNTADYEIHARIHPDTKELSAEEIISYTNKSPDQLTSLWIQLDQNIYRRDARSVFSGNEPKNQFTEGFVLESVEVEAISGRYKADYVVTDTRMQIRLAEPVKPRSGRLRVLIRYRYTIPGLFGGRTSWVSTKNGVIYDVAQWYPRMAVYDDQRGWDTQPYLGNEFYLEYGDFDYYITVPANMLVAGNGQLVNSNLLLSKTELAQIEKARGSDETVTIRGTSEIGGPSSQPENSSFRTWHYRMENSRDVAFSASSAFLWDAARIRLPQGRTALAMSFYPVESIGDGAWGRSTEYLKNAVENFSRRWFPYPYPTAVNIAGGSSGMEYPGLAFDGIDDKGKDLFWITAHEIGHTWFPMIVGFNERRNAWMDEGFNTFIDTYESDDFENGVYGPKRDPEYAPAGGMPADEIVPILKDPDAPIILTRADAIDEKYRHPITYYKSALGLVLLREQILGPDRFDWAFRKFIRDWAYKHPDPSDFFRAMESEGGEDLSWFWRGWYMNNWTLDLAVQGWQYTKGDFHQGVDVRIANLGKLVMPATVMVNFEDGTSEQVRLPVETWIRKAVCVLHVSSAKPVISVEVDPNHALPDENRSNNEFPRGPASSN